MFEIGVILFTLVLQDIPFDIATPHDPRYIRRYHNDFYGFFRANRAQGISMEILEVIWSCINPNADIRPTIFSMLKCCFVELA